MIFSEQWIREWVSPPLTTQQLMDQLTMAGLEVDGFTDVAARFSGVAVAEVIAVELHPNADKLRICSVSDGEKIVQVVCGATNVRPGLKVPFAVVGAQLTDTEKGATLLVKQTKLRGIESNGMLCSAQELGLAESADGLLELPINAPVGIDFRSYLKLDDYSIELDLTPNRGDCLGIAGIAREIAALNEMVVCLPEISPVLSQISDSFAVVIEASEQCSRYLGRVVRGINTSAETPLWMREKLRRSGFRCIDPVVDVTNFVLLELGQPMHAYDLDQLKVGITVRLANPGETLTLLDGKEIILDPDILVIADQSGPLAMAGIMGGEKSCVGSATQNVFLECAFFSPLAVAGRARRFGLHTDASHRYERGVDIDIQRLAIERATNLLLQIAGGAPGPVVEAVGNLQASAEVRLDFSKVNSMLGLVISRAEILGILSRLGFALLEQGESFIRVRVPSFRFDISIDVDLIEEIARVYGYNRLPKTRSLSYMALGNRTETRTELSQIKERLTALGYQEVITYSFVEPGLMSKIDSSVPAIALQNPISAEMSVMRTSLLPGLLTVLKYNANRQQGRVRIFECGQVFLSVDGVTHQPSRIAGLAYGSMNPELWCHSKRLLDFFDIKGDIEKILDLSRDQSTFSFVYGNHQAMHSGQTAAIHCDGTEIGIVGAIDPALQRELGISNRAYLFEIDLECLQKARIPTIRELSKFPEVNRDLAILIDTAVSGAQILETVTLCVGAYLADIRIFDVYQGDAVGKNKKSVALGLTLQHPSRTLSEDDINEIINNCVKGLEAEFNAKLRN